MNKLVQIPLKVQLNDEATFANYWMAESSSNTLCVSALKKLSSHLGDEWFVYLWGTEGCGRSHLLQAACLHAQQHQLSSQYLPLQELQSYNPLELFENLEQMDLVILDDVQMVLGNESSSSALWEEALFHLFNRVKAAGKCLLVSSSCAPKSLNVVLADLYSRLAWGTVYRLDVLQDAEKAKALQYRADLRGLELSDEVANYLLSRGSRAPRDLFALLDVLDRLSLVEKRKLTVPFIKQVL